MLEVAADLLLTGRIVDAKEAVALGLVSSSSPCALTGALQLADQISQAAPVSVRQSCNEDSSKILGEGR